ncbi:MAG: S8 family serine peptidase [Euryarchaeota archaeon]|nr:S8 family serine peptidase [Euryarchaeota archaeon]
MNKHTLTAIVVSLAFLGLTAPTGTADPLAVPTKEVNIKASQSVLEEIVAWPGFQANYVWYEIGWIGGEIDVTRYHELKQRPDVTVEDNTYSTLQCHRNNDPCDGGGGGGGETRVADQTPYGIEQIYNDATITATSGGAGVILGHLDSGIDSDHVDLVNRIVFFDGEDGNGHGTHTAGTAAADAGSDNLGIYGVASEASIRSYKVCNNGGLCSGSDIIAAIQACTNVCDVITYSIGSDGFSQSSSDAIDAFNAGGGLFVAAAGNDGSSLGSIDYPGALGSTVAVAAIDSTKTVASWSSRGSSDGCGDNDGEVAFAAAGVSVLSTWKGGGYDTISGTSMATPHVSGLALKKWTGDGGTTRSALAQGVEDITKGEHAKTGCDAASGRGLPHV